MFSRKVVFGGIITVFLAVGLIATDAFPRGGGGGGGGSRSSGGGSKSSGGGSRSSGGSSSSRSYSSPKSSSGSGGGSKSQPRVDASAQRAQRRQQSAQKFQAYRTTPDRARSFGRTVTPQTLSTRRERETRVYHHYHTRSMTYYSPGMQPIFMSGYHDPFGNMFFWMWLMDRNQHERDTWMYHHRDEIDPQRYKALQNNDAELETRLRRLEQQGVAKDPNYTPPDLKDNPDLMYGEDFVKNAHEEAKEDEDGFPWGWTIFGVVMFGIVVGIFVVFIRRS